MIEYYKKLKSVLLCTGERACAFDCGCSDKILDPITYKYLGSRCTASLDNGNMQPGVFCPCKDKDDEMAIFNLRTRGSGGA